MAALEALSRSWSDLADLIRLRNQTGSLLLLFPTLWALVLAGDGRPSLSLTAIFVTGVFVMRSAGVTVNDLWDRDLDRRVQRTRERPLASGRMQPRAALAVFLALIGIAAGLVFLLNPLTIALAPVALLLAILYPMQPIERISDLVIRAAREGLLGCQEAAALYNDVFRDTFGLWTTYSLVCRNDECGYKE